MDVEVKIIPKTENEYVRIGCYREDERVEEIRQFVRTRQGCLEGWKDGRSYSLPVTEIYYAETVDDRSFIYLKEDWYESRRRLYDLEEILSASHFIRISKSVIVNLMKIESIRPALNGRFLCRLKNDEEVIISRKYVPDVRAKLRGGKA